MKLICTLILAVSMMFIQSVFGFNSNAQPPIIKEGTNKTECNLYFGQLHSHTTYSDGAGSLDDALKYFKNVASKDNVDFISATDHSNYFDKKSKANPKEALNDLNKMTEESKLKWKKYKKEIETFNNDNKNLKALAGFEMTWSGGPGHINTFNSKGLISRNNKELNKKQEDMGLKSYYETLVNNKDPLANLSQFNHPGTTFGNFSNFSYKTDEYDEKMVLIEVGNGEGAIGSGGYFPSYSQYTLALDKGWHVAPSNNQDNHRGKWGNANDARTVIIADKISEKSLLQGIKNMSVYSTEDKNLEIDYKLNGKIMGSIINEVPNKPLEIKININDPDYNDKISKIEIISNCGRVVASKSYSSNNIQDVFNIESKEGYYYLRITQADKNIAVTAPVWIGNPLIAGISSVGCSTNLPVTNEELIIKTKIFNDENDHALLKRIDYKIGDKIIASKDLNKEIMSHHFLEEEFKYTPKIAKKETIKIIVTMMFNGVEKIFLSDIELNVHDDEKLVYVGVDASHYNEYVDGNYKDCISNFANMAVKNNVRVVKLKTKKELINATKNPKYKMLVITSPTRKSNEEVKLDYKNWSNDEINAVAKFSKQGNIVLVAGLGDYYDSKGNTPKEYHMAAQQNKILNAIGSKLRISDDEIKDDINNQGQSHRLYLSNYNKNNKFISNVDEKIQVYSVYAGSTIYTVNDKGNVTNKIPKTVSGMVYAFDTSYSSDDDKDNYAGIKIPKYNNKYMVAASEEIKQKDGVISTVIVTGSVFMSDFEIKKNIDNYLTPEFSNYTILENIVKFIN